VNETNSERHPIDALAEEFVARYRKGERPALTEYVSRHPELADEIRELFPALVMMEEVRPGSADPGGAAAAAAPGGRKPERIGDYRILREVGRGGMGVVYEAEQESLGRHVALKVLPAQALLDPRHVQRFEREAKAAARLHHTNIVPVFGVGEDAGLRYYVMQFIQGLGLDQVLEELRRLRRGQSGAGEPRQPDRAGAAVSVSAAWVAEALLTGRFSRNPGPPPPAPAAPPPAPLAVAPKAADSSTAIPLPGRAATLSGSGRGYWQSVARVGVQVAEALAHAHGQGILHRDIKPSNLLLDTHGTVWVTDFGLAKAADSDDLTHTGDVVGTLRYLAPERLQGQSDPRGDLYGLGVTLYELLTLRPAFEEADRARLVGRVLHEEPPRPRRLNPEVPRDLETVILKAIAKEPARRYATAAEMAEDLRRFLADRPVRARRASALERLWRWCRRNPVVAGLLAALVLVCAGGFAGVTWKWREAELAREREGRARREADERAAHIRRDLERLQAAYSFLESADLDAHRGRWAAAEAFYTRAVQARPDVASPWNERGVFYTRLGLWDLAAADFAESFRIQEPATTYGWQRHALLRAYVGDTTGYRAVCARMLERFHGSTDVGAWTHVADACLYWPGAVPDPAELPPLAERADGGFRHGAWKLFLLGKAHYRAGHYPQAVGLLRDSLAADPEWQDRIVNYPVLAMAHHRLGQPGEARQALDNAARAYEEWIQSLSKLYPDLRSIQWGGWVAFQVHYREARLLLEGAAPEDPRLQLLRARALAAIGKEG
jgi:serine/threonine protein kinase/Flp pilus assembly protein TadD